MNKIMEKLGLTALLLIFALGIMWLGGVAAYPGLFFLATGLASTLFIFSNN